MNPLRFFLVALSLLCMTADEAGAAEVTLKTIERYLNSLESVQAEFEQWDLNASKKSGRLAIKQPGHLRMEYVDDPLLILADGKNLFFVDRDSKDVSYMPLAQSPAVFILQGDLNLGAQFIIEEFSDLTSEVILILRSKENPDVGTIRLLFQKAPFRLIEWEITDAQELSTRVKVHNLRPVKVFRKDLFDVSPFLNK